jgi:hypothetical protein
MVLNFGVTAICRNSVLMEARSFDTARSESDRKRGKYRPRNHGGGLISKRHDHNLLVARRPQVQIFCVKQVSHRAN